MRALGARFRALREARGWPLKRLASEADVSPATLQTIESGTTNPSLLTIVAVAEALGEPLDRLIADSLAASRTVSFVHGKVARGTAGVRDLTSPLNDPRMRCTVLTLAAGRTMTDRSLPRGLPLFALVLDGEAELRFADGEVARLQKGDAIHVTRDAPTAISNPGAAPLRALCVLDTRGSDER